MLERECEEFDQAQLFVGACVAAGRARSKEHALSTIPVRGRRTVVTVEAAENSGPAKFGGQRSEFNMYFFESNLSVTSPATSKNSKPCCPQFPHRA